MLTRAQETRTVPTAAAVQLVPPNPKRVGLILSSPPTNRFTISMGGTAVLDQGITLYPTNDPLLFSAGDWG
jgi:hypothetical protein